MATIMCEARDDPVKVPAFCRLCDAKMGPLSRYEAYCDSWTYWWQMDFWYCSDCSSNAPEGASLHGLELKEEAEEEAAEQANEEDPTT